MNAGVLLLACLVAGVISGDVPQPFRIVWNYPDAPCKALHIDFGLEQFNIEHNKRGFVGDKIAIFYSDLSGKWPYIDFKNDGKWMNGGLPKDVDMPAHLAALKEAIAESVGSDDHGFGVIDMENWRPVFHTNYGRYTPYKDIFTKWMEEQHPDMPQQERRRLGNEEWKSASLDLMIKSLEAAREVSPNEKWGYYGYPQLVTKNQNVQLEDLWEAIDAYYPSIYIKNFDDPELKKAHIMDDIAENFRVRAEYGNPDDPIMPYTVAQYRNLGMFNNTWLSMAIRLPLEMGVDGLILWGSSEEFWPPKTRCPTELQFVTNTLGPLVLEEMERMGKCSEQLCSGRGRCVRKEYADKFPYLQSKGVPEEILSTAEPSGVEAMPTAEVDEEFRDFVCQCYPGAAGDRCTDAYEV